MLEKGKVHVLGDALSRAPHAPLLPEINHSSLSQVSVLLNLHEKYEEDKLFGTIIRGLSGIFPDDKIQRKRVGHLLPSFRLDNRKLIYDGMICVPRVLVREILHLAHYSRVSGHFSFSKKLARVKRFY